MIAATDDSIGGTAMDTLTPYRDAIKRVISTYARFKPSHGDIRLDVVFDETRDHYALMQAGWDRGRRVRGNLIYVTIQNGDVHIEYDGIEHGIVDDLIQAGIPEAKIVLVYLSEAQPISETLAQLA